MLQKIRSLETTNKFRNLLLLALLLHCTLLSLVNIYKRKPFTHARSGTTFMFTKVKFFLISLLHRRLGCVWLYVNWILSAKWMQGKMNSRKENEIRVFGSTMENNSKNDFRCLVTFCKCYFPTKFSHFLIYFLSFQINFITENFKIYT